MTDIGRNSNFVISNAKSHHIEDIFKLAQIYALPNLPTELASKQGFLVSGFSRETYETFLQQDHILWILEESGELRAFLLAIEARKEALDQALDEKIKEFGIADYIIIKQICTHPDHTSKGMASLLYKTFIEEYKEVPLLVAIVLEPVNYPSLAFHKKLGFAKVFDYQAPDGRPREIWRYDRGR